MSVTDRGPIGVTKALVTEIQEKQITFIAASLAYYAFVSLIPLILFLLAIASLVGGQSLANVVTGFASGALSAAGQDQLTEMLTDQSGAGTAIGVGLIFLGWSAIKVFRGMDIAFSEVYGAPGPEGIAEQVKDAVVTLVGVVIAIVITVAIGAAVSFVRSSGLLARVGLGFLEPVFGLIATLVSIVGLALALYPLYYVLPSENVGAKEAIPGAVFTAVGWTALQTVFRVYAASAGSSAYGVIGGALLLLTLLYFGGMILLVGLALNAVLAGRPDHVDADEGESDEGEPGFRERVKVRTQTILDESDADRDRSDRSDPTIADGGRSEDENRRPLVTDGGVDSDVERRDRNPDEPASDTGSKPNATPGSDARPASDSRSRSASRGSTSAATDDGTASTRSSTGTETAATTAAGSGHEHALSEEYELQREIERLRAELDAFEMEVEDRVIDRDEFEREMKGYVRERVRSGKARGWGPYLVLLYGTAMTIAIALGDAMTGGWAVFAILVVFLSTLGLYVLMVLVGLGVAALSVPGKLRNRVEEFRS